jgi:hypothetical protein
MHLHGQTDTNKGGAGLLRHCLDGRLVFLSITLIV